MLNQFAHWPYTHRDAIHFSHSLPPPSLLVHLPFFGLRDENAREHLLLLLLPLLRNLKSVNNFFWQVHGKHTLTHTYLSLSLCPPSLPPSLSLSHTCSKVYDVHCTALNFLLLLLPPFASLASDCLISFSRVTIYYSCRRKIGDRRDCSEGGGATVDVGI